MRRSSRDTFYGMCIGGSLDGFFKQAPIDRFDVPVFKPLEQMPAFGRDLNVRCDNRTETYHHRPLMMHEGQTFSVWVMQPDMSDADIFQKLIDGYRRPHVEEA